ncbi:MAG: HAD family hydrolase [Thermodesulfobacteriota bacterium]
MFSSKKRAVFFDFGDTVASTRPTYFKRLTTALRSIGYEVEDPEFDRAYLQSDYEIFMKYKSNGAISAEQYRTWFFPALCRNLNLDRSTQEIYEALRNELRKIEFGREALPGAVELLEALKDKGFLLAVISNNDGRTAGKCEEVGIRDYFDFIADSTTLGLTKPDSRIFDYALNELSLRPEEAVHIGDLWGADVMGGLNAGVDVIWLNSREVPTLGETEIVQARSLAGVLDILPT